MTYRCHTSRAKYVPGWLGKIRGARAIHERLIWNGTTQGLTGELHVVTMKPVTAMGGYLLNVDISSAEDSCR